MNCRSEDEYSLYIAHLILAGHAGSTKLWGHNSRLLVADVFGLRCWPSGYYAYLIRPKITIQSVAMDPTRYSLDS